MIEEQKEISIYCKPNNYGYRLNVKHPKINELYLRYKKWKGLARHLPLTDKQRKEFECYVFSLIDKGKL